MKPKFANSAYVHTPERLVLRGGGWGKVPLKVRYGILEHPTEGLILIDSGYGTELYSTPNRGLALRLYGKLLGPELLPEGAPDKVLARLDLSPEDVQHVVVTHLHADHVCALPRFKKARIHTDLATLQQAKSGPRRKALRHGVFPELLPDDLLDRTSDLGSTPVTEAPLGLGDGFDLLGDGSILAIPLPGHSTTHFGVCFPLLETPLLYAVDAQWVPNAITQDRIPGFPASLVAEDPSALRKSAEKVARFAKAGGDILLCHDPEDSPYDLLDQA
ncbi:MBL fold metallo-hydrolase [Thalassococcus lentus]|uniref:MBL fold metallo-hydrolase n=1 Tax=Thalassococcus lentus TaxID=1210524 RepID=A0ABT4XMX3_9RHOB|nr:MBL fold metallo-hydrolase [Thalassococcus lentus]MDA7423296.1 MBL fold metallo-hydrolase [Thalassococcus lentus]